MKVKLVNQSERAKAINLRTRYESFKRFLTKQSSRSHKLSLIEEKAGDPGETKIEDIDLYIDVREIDSKKPNRLAGGVEIAIFLDHGHENSDTSIPCIVFSLDSLIDEKIELLDAGLISEDKIPLLEKLATRLNDQGRQLHDAVGRHRLNRRKMATKSSPFW